MIILKMNHVEFPQYVAIMLEMELALVACRRDANGVRKVSRFHRVNRAPGTEAP